MSVKGINIKDVLVTKVAEDLQYQETIVETVINHQFQHAFRAMNGDNNEVEVSGLGTFIKSKAKIKRRVAKLEKIKTSLLNNPSIPGYQKKLDGVTKELEKFYSKV